MKQLVQKLADGRPCVLDVPEPTLGRGQALVRNAYSLISSGTETATVRSARKNIVAKAMGRPKDVKAVLELLRRQGPVQTYRTVMKRLDAYSPMGYSSAGRVIDSDVPGLAVGDLVACAGVGYASHAEVVAVPGNLCVKLRPDADLRAAAYNALGAIALQATRQADLRLGETCAVVGLGLVGALICQLLDASGVATIGIDVDPRAVEKAKSLGVDAFLRDDAGLESEIAVRTSGIGVDAVVIAAGSRSLDPINFAGKIARCRGRVVVVGAVPTGFDRNPDYYPKELELRMSRSYGPGRYDLNYEEKGIDYPPAYVRWTEKRNMAAFQKLAYDGKIDVNALTTRVFQLDDAPAAYDALLKREDFYLGALIEYDGATNSPSRSESEPLACVGVSRSRSRDGKIGYAFVGAGSYAQGSLLPNIPRDPDLIPVAALTRSGTTSRRVAEKFRFQRCASNPDDVFKANDVDVVFIATRHDLHARRVVDALRNGKSVFVEKPLCLTLDEYLEIRGEYEERAKTEPRPALMVGFNRRFAPIALALKSRLAKNAPMATIYRVNAGAIPLGSWIQDPEIGGGRILGEVCHFIDFTAWLADSAPKTVYAAAMPDPNGLNDTLSVQMKLQNGSIATVCYFANGSKAIAKERVEVFQAGATGILDDFRALRFASADGKTHERRGAQNKGQAEMLRAFFNALKTNAEPPVAPREIFDATLATFAVLDSLKTGKEISLS